MKVLCFDIATGGLSAAIFDERLLASDKVEIPWDIALGADGSAVLDLSTFDSAFSQAFRSLQHSSATADAVCMSAFMHNFNLLDAADQPLTPIFTWLDQRGADGVEYLRQNIGDQFHQRTGCRYHPMFPVFKLASLSLRERVAGRSASPIGRSLSKGRVRVSSAKSIALAKLTGKCVEDYGTASASGLLQIQQGTWDQEILDLLQLQRHMLPELVGRNEEVGTVTREAAARYGLRSGSPVIAGSGDGFLATTGSGGEKNGRIAITLGTSASVRQWLGNPVLDEAAGTFCYRADQNSFLLGCASNNGGNVLDWARSLFGSVPSEPTPQKDLPTFIPLLNGERSPEWNSKLTASWHGVSSHHGVQDLAHAVVDGVVFNLAHYVSILERSSGLRARQAILSGNGFLNPLTVRTLAALLDAEVLLPSNQGLASLRGAAMCGFHGLGLDPAPAIESLISESSIVPRENIEAARHRYLRYMEIRTRS